VNWFKKAVQLRDITDRNDLNKRVRELKDIVMDLRYLSDYVFQNAKKAKEKLSEIAKSKIISSFPKAKEIITKAEEKSLDNYSETGELCKDAIDILYKKIKELEDQRKEFVQKKLPELMRKRTQIKDKKDKKEN